MLAVPSCPQDAPPGARQYDRRHGQEREQGAPERDLAQRIAGELPLHDRIAAGEHHGRTDHVGDPARDLVASSRSCLGSAHRAGPTGRMSIRTPLSLANDRFRRKAHGGVRLLFLRCLRLGSRNHRQHSCAVFLATDGSTITPLWHPPAARSSQARPPKPAASRSPASTGASARRPARRVRSARADSA